MQQKQETLSRFEGAALLLPQKLRETVKTLSRDEREKAQEIRLRAGRRISVLLPEGEIALGEDKVARHELNGMLDIATGASAYSSRESIRAGYITVRGGYRIGLCGTAIMRDGEVGGFRTLSSVAIRIPRETFGIAESVISRLTHMGEFQSTLIISPPGGGKTTLLRDLIRMLSDGDEKKGRQPLRIALADERSEVAAVYDGSAQMDVGRHTDVIDSCPKAEAVMMLLRSMNPQVIALDEITAPEDIAAIESAANCGVQLLATAHAGGVQDLSRRVMYKKLLDGGFFKKAVVITNIDGQRRYNVSDLEVRDV